MSSASNTKMESRFTRGEKCIFAHAVVTFVLLIVLLIIYFVHLLVVSHSTQDAFATYLRTSIIEREEPKPPYLPVGVVHLEPREFMCNCMLIRYRWSLAPAHCVVARSDPDLADLLPSWRIKYRTTNEALTAKYTGTTIKRSIAHPHFNSDDYRNNLGLFEHDEAIPIYSYLYPDQFPLSEKALKTFRNDLELIGWEESWYQADGHVVHNSVRPITLEKCSMYVSSIVELRDYEYCVTLKERRNVSIAPGAVLLLNSKFVGFFSWGESRGRGVPFIILDFVHFKEWLQNIVSI